MTKETLAAKRRRQADEAERNGDLGTAWAFREDADALDAAWAEQGRLRKALERCVRWMQLREKHVPGQRRICDDARTALTADQPVASQKADDVSDNAVCVSHDSDDQQGEREDEQPQKGSCSADPTPDELSNPMFEAIWQTIKGWDVDTDGRGYHGATGNQAAAILRAIRRAQQGEREDDTAHVSGYINGWNAALNQAAQLAESYDKSDDRDSDRDDLIAGGSCSFVARKIRSLKRGAP